jgi:hypothetical protein
MLGSCEHTVPACDTALEREDGIERQQTVIKGQLEELQKLATEVRDRTAPLVRTECKAAPPMACDPSLLTAALYRADTCERDLTEARARARDVVKAWSDPQGSYDDNARVIDRLRGDE